jgi:hypothetical protein
LNGNGGGPNNGELTVYSHTSQRQLSGLGDSQDSAFSVTVPAASQLTLGPDKKTKGWEHLTLKGSPEVFSSEDVVEEEDVPVIPVPDEAPGSLWAVPLEVFAKTQTRLALTNSTDKPAVVRVYLLDRKGNRLAGTLDPNLNPLSPGQQVVKSVDQFFPELIGLTEFFGTIVVKAERELPIWAMGVIGDQTENPTIRRALNMNVDLDGIKLKMTKELEEIAAREAALQKQMAHLEAVLQLTGNNGDFAGNSSRPVSSPPEAGTNFSETSG